MTDSRDTRDTSDTSDTSDSSDTSDRNLGKESRGFVAAVGCLFVSSVSLNNFSLTLFTTSY